MFQSRTLVQKLHFPPNFCHDICDDFSKFRNIFGETTLTNLRENEGKPCSTCVQPIYSMDFRKSEFWGSLGTQPIILLVSCLFTNLHEKLKLEPKEFAANLLFHEP